MKLNWTILLLLISLSLSSQNLIPNGSFDQISSCPTTEGQIDFADGWISPTRGSTDLYHRCAGRGPCITCVPDQQNIGFQDTHSGDGMMGMFLLWQTSFPTYREYVQARLSQPLVAGQIYEFSMQIVFTEYSSNACEGPQVLFSPNRISGTTFDGFFTTVPTIEFDTIITDFENWTELRACFTAQGGEEFITLGNFKTNAGTRQIPVAPADDDNIYYLMDDFELRQKEEINDFLPADTVICQGDSIEICLPEDVNFGWALYTWSDGMVTPKRVLTDPGIYWVDILSECGIGRDSIVIGQGDPPLAQLPDFIFFCEGGDVIVQPPINNASVLWSTGSTADSLIIDSPGLYWMQLTNACGSTRDSVMVTEVSEPRTILPADTFLCEGDTLWLTADISFNPIWQNSFVGDSFPVFSEDTISLEMSNICGIVVDVMAVKIVEQPFVALGQNQFICTGDSVLLQPWINGDSWVWQDGRSDTSRWIKDPGWYWVEVMNECGIARDSTQVFVEDRPSSNLPTDTLLCSGETWTIQYPTTYQVEWQDGSTNTNYSITQSGRYIVTLKSNCGDARDTVDVMLGMLPSVDLPQDSVFCEGDSIILTYSGSDQWQWSDSSRSRSVTLKEEGVFSIFVANQCGSATDSIAITLDNPPSINLGFDFSICELDTDTIRVSSTESSWIWQDGSSNQFYVVSQAGNYFATAQNACGLSSDTVRVEEIPLPQFDSISQDIQLCIGDSIRLSAASGNGNVYWQGDSTSAVLLVREEGTYTVVSENQCGTTEVEVQVTTSACGCPIYIPNAFSPNGDNLNDEFQIFTDCPITKMTTQIFDRWGEMVFSSDLLDPTWKGTFNGNKSHSGVYAYIVQFTIGGEVEVRTGSLTIIE